MSSFSVLSNFPLHPYDAETLEAKRRRKEKRRAEKEEYKKLQQQRLLRNDNDNQVKDLVKVDPTDSPLRRWVKWILSIGGSSEKKTIFIWLSIVIFVKWSIGLGGYSGYKVPPLRGDFEAQRHWISLTSSIISLDSIKLPFLPIQIPLYHPSSTSPSTNNVVVPISEWYSHDLEYWGLDYPPLTAYHSFLMGFIARLSPTTAQYVTLRPHSFNSTQEESIEWERVMGKMESSNQGGMRNWMRATVVIGDLFMWVSAVLWYCWHNFGSDRSSSSSGRSSSKKVNEKALRTTVSFESTTILSGEYALIPESTFTVARRSFDYPVSTCVDLDR
jgi:alpha-1,3-glucosyltransferase